MWVAAFRGGNRGGGGPRLKLNDSNLGLGGIKDIKGHSRLPAKPLTKKSTCGFLTVIHCLEKGNSYHGNGWSQACLSGNEGKTTLVGRKPGQSFPLGKKAPLCTPAKHAKSQEVTRLDVSTCSNFPVQFNLKDLPTGPKKSPSSKTHNWLRVRETLL